MHDGLFPEKIQSINWLRDHFMIKEGYSLEDIDNMESERYDFINFYIMEKKISGKENIFSGGL